MSIIKIGRTTIITIWIWILSGLCLLLIKEDLIYIEMIM